MRQRVVEHEENVERFLLFRKMQQPLLKEAAATPVVL
jgi:hypothetical protein